VLNVLLWALASDHASVAQAIKDLRQILPSAVFLSGTVWLYSLAIEPWGRRELAGTMVSWSRVLAGRWRDPLVGRDILIGLLFGLGLPLALRLEQFYVVHNGGAPVAASWTPHESRYLINLMGPFSAMTGVVHAAWSGLTNALYFFAFLLVLGLLLRKVLGNRWVATVGLLVYLTVTNPNTVSPFFMNWALHLPESLLILIVVLRFGPLTLATGFLVHLMLIQTFLTTDFSLWYGASSLVVFIVITALALLGFRLSLLGRPIWPAGAIDK
jgi:serine/threonine-protein kinase